jgi:hypothetical protein
MRLFMSVMLVFALGSAAQAEDFGVAYTVEEKTFKRYARSDHVLIFELFSDPDCTTLLHSDTHFAGDEHLVVDLVKRFKVRRSKVRPPRMAVLRTNLDVASLVAPLYLRVTGESVVGLGGECQIQMSAVTGPQGVQGDPGATGLNGEPGADGLDGQPGADGLNGVNGLDGANGADGADGANGTNGVDGEPGPAGPPGPSLRVFDALGAEIGWLAQWNSGSEIGTYRVFVESVGATIRLDLGGTLTPETPGGQIFFAEFDCMGQAFVERRYVGRVTSEGGRFFIGREEPSSDPEYLSRLPGINCNNDQDSGPLLDAVPADEIVIEDLGLTFPLPAPLYVGLPAE